MKINYVDPTNWEASGSGAGELDASIRLIEGANNGEPFFRSGVATVIGSVSTFAANQSDDQAEKPAETIEDGFFIA